VQAERFEDAEKVADGTIALYPNSPVGYVDRAYVYLSDQRYDQGLESVNRALDVSPIDAEALRVKAIILSEKGEMSEAESVFNTALLTDPTNPEIMRDYYQHLRDAGNDTRMLELVHQVIEQEKPYCVEDYWFLADYYRESDKNVKAFHYLRKAYKSMPGERELMPPMADILIDMGHISYALPFLRRYIESNGWNEIMEGFVHHRRLKGKWSQEGLRFLRYWGEKPRMFREFVFGVYFQRFFLGALAIVAPVILLFATAFFKTTGFFIVASMLLAALVSFKISRLVIRREKLSQSAARQHIA
jgi:tetratricopeptide (TPR) repeat protein